MTLAVILFVCILCPSAHSLVVAPRQSADQSAAVANPASAAGTQDNNQPAQSSTQPVKPTTSPQTQTPVAKKAATTRPRRRKKKPAVANCVPASASTPNSPAPASTGDSAQGSSKGAPSSNPTATPRTVCPPPKTVVRQGGTSEPAIQLAGGAVGDQAAQQRDTANEMLGATELNLKKIAGTQLTASQQDMVNQIHQFIDQSKSAASAGDLERARTLAWKAQLLSEEVVGPQK